MANSDLSPEELLHDLLEARSSEMAAQLRDGRHLRAERGRAAVVQATFEMINAGESPTIAVLAERAGVSERTVFRYFPDRDSLMLAVAAEVAPLIGGFMSLERPEGDISERLRRLLQARVELMRIGGRFAAYVESTAPESPLAKNLVSMRIELLSEQVAIWLSPEVESAGEFALPMINEVLSHRAVGHYLQSMSDEEVIDMLHAGIRRLLSI